MVMCFETSQPYRLTPTVTGAETEDDTPINLGFGSGPSCKLHVHQCAKISPLLSTEETAEQAVH